jgi:hypothetical protein
LFWLVFGIQAQDPVQPKVKAYDLEVGFFPDAILDYAGFFRILYGKRPGWNKEDSLNHYPHMLGKTRVTLEPGNNAPESLVFYLHSELRVHSIKSGGTELKFTQKRVFYPDNYSLVANKVVIKPKKVSEEKQFLICYGGVFNPSYSNSPSDYMRIDMQGAYLRGYGYSLWFPVFLDSRQDSYGVDFTRVKIVTPKSFRACFIGEKCDEFIQDDKRVSLWKGANVDLHDVQIAVRPYKTANNRGIHLYYLPKKKSRASVKDIDHFVNRLKTLFETHYRKITTTPQLHIAELPNYASGISSGNMIGMTSAQWQNFSLSRKNTGLMLLVSHELVHTYVQVKVGINSPLAAMVIEGFPSYFHLPILAEILGEEWYQTYMILVEKAYLERKKSKKTRWGSPLPKEKPILSLTRDEIGEYKDTFILNDRVRLFLHFIREKLGKKRFRHFTHELCHLPVMNVNSFYKLINKYMPNSNKDLNLWLKTNQYPERWFISE